MIFQAGREIEKQIESQQDAGPSTNA